MPWRELSIMDQRDEFVRLALARGANRSELCRRFGISRYRAQGGAALADRSRRPHSSPTRTPEGVETEVLRIRAASNNAWGGRKIAKVLRDLFVLKGDKELSFGERKMLDTARNLLVKELAIAKSNSEEKIMEELRGIFAN